MAVVSGVRVRLFDVGKKLVHAKRVYGLAGMAIVMLVGGGVWAMQSANSQYAAEQKQASAAKVQDIGHELKDAELKQAPQPAQQEQQAFPRPTATNQPAPKASAPKYATSSDPRSTAYSTTPPAPNPSSFETRITRNGQVAAGTLISYNASKGERGYYGGDLVFSTPSVTISKSGMHGSSRPEIRVSTPDGAAVNMPSLPWYERSQVFMAMDASKYKSSGSWFDMIIEHSGAPTGTYQLPFYTNRSAQTADAWYYYGFLTVHIVD